MKDKRKIINNPLYFKDVSNITGSAELGEIWTKTIEFASNVFYNISFLHCPCFIVDTNNIQHHSTFNTIQKEKRMEKKGENLKQDKENESNFLCPPALAFKTN